MAMQQHISYDKNRELVGQTLPVLVDLVTEMGLAEGRTQWDAPEVDNTVQINIKPGQRVVPGEVLDVKITGCTPYDLKGEPVL